MDAWLQIYKYIAGIPATHYVTLIQTGHTDPYVVTF